MSLVRCKECDGEISKKADKCPGCGAPVKQKSGCAAFVLIAFIVCLIAYFANSSIDENEIAAPEVETPLPKIPDESDLPDAVYPKPSYAEILNDRTIWPDALTLSEDQESDIFLDGELVGSQVFPAGSRVKFVRALKDDVLEVSANGASIKVPVEDTDFVESVHSLIRAKVDNDRAASLREKQATIRNAIAEQEEAKRQLEIQKKIENQFSSYDGKHYELVRITKAGLKDPDSFQHIDTRVYKYEDSIGVLMNYRAKNSFGGYVVGSALADFDFDGKLIKIHEGE